MVAAIRLNDRHAFFTRELPDGRVVDVQPWPGRRAKFVVSASAEPWSVVAIWWYADVVPAVLDAMHWDGVEPPRSGQRERPRC